MDAAAKLRAARLHAGLTQPQLAELSGVRQANIAAYERDLRHPSRLMLQRLLDVSRPRPSSSSTQIGRRSARLPPDIMRTMFAFSARLRDIQTDRTVTSTCWLLSTMLQRWSIRPHLSMNFRICSVFRSMWCPSGLSAIEMLPSGPKQFRCERVRHENWWFRHD